MVRPFASRPITSLNQRGNPRKAIRLAGRWRARQGCLDVAALIPRCVLSGRPGPPRAAGKDRATREAERGTLVEEPRSIAEPEPRSMDPQTTVFPAQGSQMPGGASHASPELAERHRASTRSRSRRASAREHPRIRFEISERDMASLDGLNERCSSLGPLPYEQRNFRSPTAVIAIREQTRRPEAIDCSLPELFVAGPDSP
jgi:hypothetical protein